MADLEEVYEGLKRPAPVDMRQRLEELETAATTLRQKINKLCAETGDPFQLSLLRAARFSEAALFEIGCVAKRYRVLESLLQE
jgi:hypothetical protein